MPLIIPVFQMKELRLNYIKQLMFEKGTGLVKAAHLELYLISPGFTQNTHWIPTEYVHLRTAKKTIITSNISDFTYTSIFQTTDLKLFKNVKFQYIENIG